MRDKALLDTVTEEGTSGELNYLWLWERNRLDLSPEHKLMLAILTRALLDALQPIGVLDEIGRSKIRFRENALAFFHSEDVEPFSFLWLCDMLSAHPDGLRERILAVVNSDNREELFNRYFPRKRRPLYALRLLN